MEIKFDVWPFILALAAVINALGIIRLLNTFAEYLRKRKSLNIQHYSVYVMLVIYQLFIHLLFWWSAMGLRAAGDINFNFLMYLYLLTGPTILYLGTSLILPDLEEESRDMRTIYYGFHKAYYTILAMFMFWGIFVWPVFGYSFAPNAPLLATTLLIALVLRATVNPKIHFVLMVTNLSIYALTIAVYAMRTGGVTRIMIQG
jgi:hypothetical protein